jgi:hypothetical protein
MKKLILLFLITISISAQSLKFGANISVNSITVEKIYLPYGDFQESSSEEKGFAAISFSGDLSAFFSKYFAVVLELGATLTEETSSQYSTLDFGILYSTNLLFENIYFKTGFYGHLNGGDNSRFTNYTFYATAFGVGIQIFDNAALEGEFQIPINKSYAKDDFTEFKLKNIWGFGLKLTF